MSSFAVIIPAAGSSSRFGRNKLLEPLDDGKPVILHTLRAFTRRSDVTHIVVPTSDYASIHDALMSASPTILSDSRLNFCPGGSCRAESVRCGLEQLPDSVEWLAVHDAARPMVSQSLIDETLAAAVQYGAAVPALPVHLTIKQATGPLPAKVERTIPRSTLWAMQTPQMMRARELRQAFANCPIPLDQITDDAQLLELSGVEVWLIEGEQTNVKITTEADLVPPRR